jgi:hypothetical protein
MNTARPCRRPRIATTGDQLDGWALQKVSQSLWQKALHELPASFQSRRYEVEPIRSA